MISIILLALAGAIIASIVGTVWYMPSTPMGKIHMQTLGFDKLSPEEQQAKIEAAKPMMPRMYAVQMALSFILSFEVATIITLGLHNGLSLSTAILFVVANWFCFMIPVIGGSILWSNIDRSIALKKFFSDALSYLVTVVLVSLLAAFFA